MHHVPKKYFHLGLVLALAFLGACGVMQKNELGMIDKNQNSAVVPENPGDLLPSEATAAALPPGVIFADDFSNPLSGWDTRREPDAITDYHNGKFVIFVGKTDTAIWSVANRRMNDVVIEVTTNQAGGPDDNLYGVVCRYQDKDNFYRFVVSGRGYAGITKRVNGSVVVLSGPKIQKSEFVNLGQSENLIRAICFGSQLSLYVNDQLAAEVVDADFPDGDIGLIASSGKHPGVEIHFTDFVVKEP